MGGPALPARLLALAVLAALAAATVDEFCRELGPSPPHSGAREPLRVGSFLPKVSWDEWAHRAGRGSEGDLAASLRPAIELALEDVAAHPCLLKAHRLHVDFKDTRCSASQGMRAFFELMKKEKAAAVFGDACTEVNEPLAMTAKYWDLLQLSYAETHPKFADPSDFPTFYRMVPGDADKLRARIAFLQHFNWTRLGSLKQSDEPRRALPHEAFTTRLSRHEGVRVLHTADFSSEKPNVTGGLADLKAKDARVLVGDFGPDFARRVFCQAYRQNFYGANYVWLIPGYQGYAWWEEGGSGSDEDDCSAKELLAAMEGHFITEAVVTRQWSSPAGLRGLNGRTVDQYLASYASKCSESKSCDPTNALHAYAYDGIFTLAYALDAAVRAFPSEGLLGAASFRLDSLGSEEGRRWLIDALHSALNRTAFLGLTGHVRFHQRGRVGKIRLAQFTDGAYRTVGEWDGAEEELRLAQPWATEWRPPRDGTRLVYRRERVRRGLRLGMSSLAVLGILLALGFLALNIRFRGHRFIRMSSPNMNNLIIAGSLMCYVSVFLLGLDAGDVGEAGFPALCYSKVWVLCFGFTLSFGSMFSKTWRVHSIFTNIKLNKKAIKDYKLFLLVGVLVIVDAVVLGSWVAVSPTHLRLADLRAESSSGEVGAAVIEVPQQELCHSSSALVFQSLLYGYKGLLLLLGCFLAWETRHVNVPALNDSKHIGASVYGCVVMCLLGVSLSFVLTDKVNQAFVVSSLAILISTTLTLALVFGPKALEIAKNPKGLEVKKYRHGMLSGDAGVGRADSSVGVVNQGVAEEERGSVSSIQADLASSRQTLGSRARELEGLMDQLSAEEPEPKESGVAEASVSSVPEDPVLPHPLPSSPRSTALQDVDEETSLLPSPDEKERKKSQPLFNRIRASLKRPSGSLEPEDPGGRREGPGPEVAVVSVTPTPRLPPVYYSMPELGLEVGWRPRSAESNSLASTALPASLFSESDPSRPLHLRPQPHPPTSSASNRVLPFQPTGDGISRLRYIDSVISEDGDVVLNHSRTLQSIDETQASGELEEDWARPDGAAKAGRAKRRTQRRSHHHHLWPWLDPSLPVTQV